MGNLDTKPIVVSRDPLFRPFTVKTLNLKNRIVMSAMGQANAKNGVPDSGYPAYECVEAEANLRARDSPHVVEQRGDVGEMFVRLVLRAALRVQTTDDIAARADRWVLDIFG